MATELKSAMDPDQKNHSKLSIDWWAVLLAAAAVVLVKLGVLHPIPW